MNWIRANFDRLDVILLTGTAMLFSGLHQIYPPSAWIASGAVFLLVGLYGLMRAK